LPSRGERPFNGCRRARHATSAPLNPTALRPPGFAARAAATGLLATVLDDRRPLDAALDGDGAFGALPLRDRALARAILGTTLRRLGTIEAILNRLVTRRPRADELLWRTLQTTAAQVLFMEVADHAAVSLALDQLDANPRLRPFKGLANAVLRRIARERDALVAAAETPGSDTPPWLWQRWVATYGEATAASIAAMHRLEAALDISVKSEPQAWAEKLGGAVLPTGSLRLLATGDVTALPGYAEGAWWIQGAAAALPARLLGDVTGKAVADLCAAPGGKTAELANRGANVTAVDISPPRMARVADNLRRLGLGAETVVADVLSWQPDRQFDAVLLDAPCTATGTIRRHPDVAWLKQPEDIASLAAMQTRMLERAVALLKPGGTLVFCTCSLEPEEGEAHLAPSLAGLSLEVVPIAAAEIGGLAETVTADGGVRTLPSHLPDAHEARRGGLEGFFIMRLRKRL